MFADSLALPFFSLSGRQVTVPFEPRLSLSLHDFPYPLATPLPSNTTLRSTLCRSRNLPPSQTTYPTLTILRSFCFLLTCFLSHSLRSASSFRVRFLFLPSCCPFSLSLSLPGHFTLLHSLSLSCQAPRLPSARYFLLAIDFLESLVTPFFFARVKLPLLSPLSFLNHECDLRPFFLHSLIYSNEVFHRLAWKEKE